MPLRGPTCKNSIQIEFQVGPECGNYTKERCHAKFLEGHLNELGLLIGPNKSGSFIDEAA